MRNLSTELATQVASAAQRCAELVELTLGTTTYCFTNASFHVVANGKTYLALGDFLGFTDIEETSDMAIASVTITLSGIDPMTVTFRVGNVLNIQENIECGFFKINFLVDSNIQLIETRAMVS